MTITDDIAEALENIRKAGGLTPSRVVKVASRTDSILHGLFEWDDSSAAHQFRLNQARRIIATRVIHEPRTQRTISTYIHIPSPTGEGEYIPTIMAVRSPDKLALARDAVLRNLRSAQDNLDELDEAIRLFGTPEKGSRVRRASVALGTAQTELAGV